MCGGVILVLVVVLLFSFSVGLVSSTPRCPTAKTMFKERIDRAMQESHLEDIHPWASAVFAHTSYFSNFDTVMFLINRLDEGLEEEQQAQRRRGCKGGCSSSRRRRQRGSEGGGGKRGKVVRGDGESERRGGGQ